MSVPEDVITINSMEEDDEHFDYIMDQMCVTVPYGIEEAEALYNVINDIIQNK